MKKFVVDAHMATKKMPFSPFSFAIFLQSSMKWRTSLKLAFADGLPFAAPHRELETNSFRATAYRRAEPRERRAEPASGGSHQDRCHH